MTTRPLAYAVGKRGPCYRQVPRTYGAHMSIARSEYTYCAPTIPTKLRVVRDGDAVRTAAPGELPAVVGAGPARARP